MIMQTRTLILLFSACSLAFAQTDTLVPEAAITALRGFAEGYLARLQDFSCDREVKRSGTHVGKENNWKATDTSEEEIDYVEHSEKRRLLSLNGVAVKSRARPKSGIAVGGEFGLLGRIFSEKAKAQIQADHQEAGKGGLVCVFRYRIAEADAPITGRKGKETVTMGHHGLIYSYCASGVVIRLDAESDREPDKGMAMKTSIRFAPVTIAGKEFILPTTAEDISRSEKTLTRAEVIFRNYRKYDASSAIHFEPQENPK